MNHRLTRVLLALLSALLLVGLAPPAYAGPDPTTGPARAGDPLPVEITITSVTPTVGATPDQLTVRATITNTGTTTITDLWARLQRDNRMDDRGDLTKVDQEQPNYTTRLGPGDNLGVDLPVGSSRSIELTATLDDLAIVEPGAYPVLINLNGITGSTSSRVGQAAFTLPYFPTAAPVQVAWMWPLIDRPHRLVDQALFLDDDLARSIRTGGRLDRLLTAVETYGATAQMTVMLDPGLIADLVAMTTGYQYLNADGEIVTGEGAPDAVDYLERLRAVAANISIATTAYADIDTVAVVRSGLGDLLTDARAHGTAFVDDVLQTTTISDIDWPVGGLTTEAAVSASEAAGVHRFVLTGDAFGDSDYLSSDDGITESAATELPAAGPQSVAIVADPALARILGDGGSYAAGPYAATQRLTAELAMIGYEAPTRARNVLLAPPRRWDPSAEYLTSVLTLTTTAPWLTPVSFDTVLSTAPEDRGPLEYPAALSTEELPVSAIDSLKAPISEIGTLSSAFNTADVPTVLGPATEAVYRALSTAQRADPAGITSRADAITAALNDLRSKIRIVPPSAGTYTLSSSEAPLVFTVENNLNVAVRYRIGLDPRASTGLTVADTGVLEIGANSRATVRLPTSVERSGTFSVIAQISTPDGQPLGNDVPIRVTSTAYGTVALAVTAAAFVLLLALIGRRGIRRQRARAAQRAADAEAAADEPHEDEYAESSWLDERVAASLDTHDVPHPDRHPPGTGALDGSAPDPPHPRSDPR